MGQAEDSVLPADTSSKSRMGQAEDSVLPADTSSKPRMGQAEDSVLPADTSSKPRMGQAEDSVLPADTSSKPRSGKGTQTDSGVSMRHCCQKTWESIAENSLIQKHSKSAVLCRVLRWISHQRPVRVEHHCQARCDHRPRRQCILFGLNLKLGNEGENRCIFPLLDCLKRRQPDHTCHHAHRVTELATKTME